MVLKTKWEGEGSQRGSMTDEPPAMSTLNSKTQENMAVVGPRKENLKVEVATVSTSSSFI
jgi:hypothetical protein